MATNYNSYSNFYHKKGMKDFGYPAGVLPIDLQNDKRLYGRVDRSQDAVLLTEKNISVGGTEKSVIKQLDSKKPVFALNFVADAFRDMKTHFSKANAFSRLASGGMEEITKLEAQAGRKDVQLAYTRHIATVFETFKEQFLFGSKRYKEIITFADYMKHFDDFYKDFGDEIPLTKTGFIKSRLASPLISGMIIEVAKFDPSDDSSATKWISDPNFNFYRNAAIKYGFLVDEYMPWRLVADISSRFMQDRWQKIIYPTADQIESHRIDPTTGEELAHSHANYLSFPEIMDAYRKVENKYGLIYSPGGASNLFEKYYEKTYPTDAMELKRIFYKMYNDFVLESPAISKLSNVPCKSKKLAKSLTKREPLTKQDLGRYYDVYYWAEVCFKVRLKEEAIKIESNDYRRILRNMKVVTKKTLDMAAGMKYINNMIKALKSQIVNPKYCQDYQRCL